MNTERANVVSRGECGKCGSSDGNVLYDNGSRYCFVCETYTAAEGSDKIVSVTERKVHTMNTPLSQGQFSAVEDRGISLEAAKAYGITVAGEATGGSRSGQRSAQSLRETNLLNAASINEDLGGLALPFPVRIGDPLGIFCLRIATHRVEVIPPVLHAGGFPWARSVGAVFDRALALISLA